MFLLLKCSYIASLNMFRPVDGPKHVVESSYVRTS